MNLQFKLARKLELALVIIMTDEIFIRLVQNVL